MDAISLDARRANNSLRDPNQSVPCILIFFITNIVSLEDHKGTHSFNWNRTIMRRRNAVSFDQDLSALEVGSISDFTDMPFFYAQQFYLLVLFHIKSVDQHLRHQTRCILVRHGLVPAVVRIDVERSR